MDCTDGGWQDRSSRLIQFIIELSIRLRITFLITSICDSGPPSEILQDNEISFGIDQNFTTTPTETTMHTDDASDRRNDEERKEKGVVSLSVYVAYWKYVGSILVLLILISVVAMQVGTRIIFFLLYCLIILELDILLLNCRFRGMRLTGGYHYGFPSTQMRVLVKVNIIT